MKKLIIMVLAGIAISASAQFNLGNLGNILGGSDTGKAGDIINTVSSLVGNNKVELASLSGSWKYYSPAVTFQSDNLLQKAGGAAASVTIQNKLAPYYQKAGLTNLVMTFNEDNTFALSSGKLSCSGTITPNEDDSYTFSFTAFGKLPAGSLTGYIEKKGSNITLTFDASKLIAILSKVASFSGNSTLKSASSLLESYDGINVGFELAKE